MALYSLSELSETHDMTNAEYLARLKRSFPFFMGEAWKSIGFHPPSWIQLDIASFMEGNDQEIAVLAFRGLSKTTIANTQGLHQLYVDPNKTRIPIISKTYDAAVLSVKQIRYWLSACPFMAHLVPKGDQLDQAGQFNVNLADPAERSPSVKAYGITNQMTGMRGTHAIVDDIETLENVLTIDQRQKLYKQFTEISNLMIPGANTRVVGTYHHEESLYLKLNNIGYNVRSWTARYPTNKQRPRIIALSPTYDERIEAGKGKVGAPAWPQKFTEEDLVKREAKGLTNWLQQYMMIANLGDENAYPLKLRDLIVFDVQKERAPASIMYGTRNCNGSTSVNDLPMYGFQGDGLYQPAWVDTDWQKYQGTRMWIDPSGRGLDRTGYAIVSHLNSHLYVQDVGGLQGGFDPDVLHKLARLAREHHVNIIQVEGAGLQEMFVHLMIPVLKQYYLEPGEIDGYPDGWRCSIEDVRIPNVQKELRIIQYLEPVMNNHKLVVKPETIANQELQRQITRITKVRNCLEHEDELDALAHCVGQWADVLQIDPERLRQKRKEEAYNERLKHYSRLATGNKEQRPRWFKHH